MHTEMDIDASVNQPEEDEDSLFGSPPPSPIRGRSPSPALALPGGTSSGLGSSCSAQNVGTIALPGSHFYSELPVNPLALSLSLPHHGALAQGSTPHVTQMLSHSVSSPSTPSWSRASSAAPMPNQKKKPTKPTKAKSKESTPRPPPPQIPLPDPSNPPPANFLRNQSALLGTAGLVGGVRPASLSVNRHTRGTTSSNPIVVEDEDEPPLLGRNSKFRQPYTQTIDPSLLPAPTNQEIVAMLIGQKDIFPVLESILRLIAAGSGTQTSPFTAVPVVRPPAPPSVPPARTNYERRTSSQIAEAQQYLRQSKPNARPISSEGPSTKKRKLHSVPAGAADWDVPYPFPQGEGPDAYRSTWERERGKQLISQLVSLIKNAARKAATKNYLQNEHARRALAGARRTKLEPYYSPWPGAGAAQGGSGARGGASASNVEYEAVKVRGHYRPATVLYGLEGEAAASAKVQVQEVLADASNGKGRTSGQTSKPGTSWSVTGGVAGSQPSTPFDQLISSLLAASPEQTSGATTGVGGAGIGSTSASASMGTGVGPSANGTSAVPTPTGGSWKTGSGDSGNTLDQGMLDSWMSILQTFPMPSEGFGQQLWDQSSQVPSSVTSSPRINAEYMGTLDVPFDFDFDGSLAMMSTTPIMDSLSDLDFQPQNAPAGPPSLTPDTNTLIDPTLLAISIPQPIQASAVSNTPESGTPSTAPSPMPSMSSSGDPEPMTPNSASWDLSMPDIAIASGFGEEGLIGGMRQGVEDLLGSLLSYKDKGKGKVVEMRGDVSTTAGTPSSIQEGLGGPVYNPYQSQATSYSGPVTSTSNLRTAQAGERAPTREDILKRANKRKRQLMAGIDQVKTQLWETTIEQGALAHISAHYAG